MRKDIMDILWYAKKKGFQIIIYSNGSLINQEMVKELKRLGPNKIDITIPAISKTNFEHITDVVGSRNKVFKAINLLYKNGIKLGFKTCVLKENESEIKQIQGFARSLHALHRLDDMLFLRLDGSPEPYNYRSPSVISMLQRLKLKEGISDGCGFKEIEHIDRNEELFPCGVGQTQAAITPSGELKMCLMIGRPKYKILDTSLKQCWMRLKEFKESIRPDKNYKCDSCKLKAYCRWCPARARLYNGSLTACDPESRLWSQLRKSQHPSYAIHRS